jgi:hypothetical protein
VTDGVHAAGFIEQIGKRFIALNADRRTVGRFNTLRAARERFHTRQPEAACG